MRHLEAWQIAGQICDMLHETSDTVTTAEQHEKMADTILKYHDKVFDEHEQEWLDPTRTRSIAPGVTAHVVVHKGKDVE